MSQPADGNATLLSSIGSFIFDPVSMIITVFGLIVVGVMFFAFRWMYRRYKLILDTPVANAALVGYYVKFAGVVARHNEVDMPIKNKKCEFYRLKIIGKWSVKAKSPSSGMTEITKQLYYESNNKFLLKNGTTRIFVEFENDKDIETSKYETKVVKGDAKDIAQKYNATYPKAKKYEYILNYLLENDEITVYGKLSKKGDDLIITDTYSSSHPFMLKRGNRVDK